MKKYILIMIFAMGLYAEEIEGLEDFNQYDFYYEETYEETIEDDFFGDSFDTSSFADLKSDFNTKSITLNGDFKMSTSLSDYDAKATAVSGGISSNLNLDVRLKDGVKAYTSFNLKKTNAQEEEFLKLNEMFFDFNIDNKVYIRSGKQNLAWGRGYFFNPTDLINIEKKRLDDVGGQREGNFGIKAHIPYGFSKNVYGYLQMEDKVDAKDLSLALKYEFLVKNSEYSIATILRNPQDYDPVLGLDFSSSWGKAQTFGEVLIQNGDKIERYTNNLKEKEQAKDEFGNLITILINGSSEPLMIPKKPVPSTFGNKLIVQGTIGYSRNFDIGAVENKKTLTLIQEFYYNGAGYSKETKSNIPSYSLAEQILYSILKGEALPFYNPYSDGIYYLANFVTMNKFLHKDMNLGINTLSNLSDNVHQLGANVSYKLNDEVKLGTSITGFLGKQGALSGNIPKYTIGISADMSF